MSQNFSGQNLRGRSFRGQDLTGTNFSHSDLRGTDFSRAILRGANFSYAKAGYRCSWLILVLSLSLTIAAASLAYQSSVLRQLAAFNGKVNNALAEQLSIVLGAVNSLLGALAVSLVTPRNQRAIKSLISKKSKILTTQENLLLFGVFLNLLGTFFLIAFSLKDLINFFSGPWQPRGGSIFPPYFLAPLGSISEFSYLFLSGILAGNAVWMLTKVSDLNRKNLLFISFKATIAGVFFQVLLPTQMIYLIKHSMIIIFLLSFIASLIITFPLSFVFDSLGISEKYMSSFYKGFDYSYMTIVLAIPGAIATKVGKLVSLMPVTAFFLAMFIGSDLNYRIPSISWKIMSITFLYSFCIAIATERTSFQEADLTDANLTKAIVQYADFTKAKFDNINK